MISLDNVKQYLKLEYNDDDETVQMLMEVAIGYVETELGRHIFDGSWEVPRAVDLAIMLLVSYWYDNRSAMVSIKNKQLSAEVKFGVSSLLNPHKFRQV